MVDRTPLRVKLVAAILLLVTAALLVIGAANVLVLRSYLIDRTDEQLRGAAATRELNNSRVRVVVPVDYVRTTTQEGKGADPDRDPRLSPDDLPRLVTGMDDVAARDGHPYTTVSPNGRVRWRMLVTVLPSGAVLHLG